MEFHEPMLPALLQTGDAAINDDAMDEMKCRESRQLGAVRHVVVKGAVDVLFRRSDRPELLVAGSDAGIVRSVKTHYVGDRLIIEREGVSFSHNNGDCTIIGACTSSMYVNGRRIFPQGDAVAGIALPELPVFTLQGGGAALCGLNQPELRIDLQGYGRIGAFGRVGSLDVTIQGSGDVEASGLLAGRGDLRISGSGNIAATVHSAVCAEISGTGSIVVRGNPARCRERVTGLGSVRYV
jgi:hypothetical protein